MVDNFCRSACHCYLSVMEQDGAVAESLNCTEIVRDQYNCPAVVPKMINEFQTLCLKNDVADSQDFVQEQNVGIEVGCYRETEPHIHACRVALHRDIDVFGHASKVDNAI